jgi:hypothetical protein
MQSPPSLKRERFEDPLDLSSSQPNSKRIKEESEPVETGLSGHQDPESWSVERVAAFVENIETCQEYAEVSSCKLQSFVFFLNYISDQTSVLFYLVIVM